MMRDVITICVGQCGIQMGQKIWEQYCAEHCITPTGSMESNSEDNRFECLFQETETEDLYTPRSLMIDTEPDAINNVRRSKFSKIFDHNFLLHGNEDAANNFIRGHYTVYKGILEDQCKDRIRKLVENCNNVQGFILNHSIGGGTGSGVGTRVLEHLDVNHKKKLKIGFELFPSPNISNCIVEPYNAILTAHWLLHKTDVSVVLDNEAIYQICDRELDMRYASYDTVNRLIAKTVSSITSGLRFEEQGTHSDLQAFQTNLVPFPRLHFMITSMAPINTRTKKETMPKDIQSMTELCFSPQNFFTKLAGFDVEKDLYMAVSVNYHGDVRAKAANRTVQLLKTNKKLGFVEWVPTGFKIGLSQQTIATVENDECAHCEKAVSMIGNNVAVARVFSDIARKYDSMYCKRAFVHWFVGLGLDEGFFHEAREDMSILEKEYSDVLAKEISVDKDIEAADAF